MSRSNDPRVVGMADFAPTRDSPSFVRAEEGALFKQNLKTAQT